MAQSGPVTVERRGDVAWVTIDNPPVNVTSTAVRAGLLDAVGRVAGARVAVLACAGATFVSGGDMAEFDAPPAPPDLPDVVRALEDSAVPFVASLHGSVLGGGWELAMGCAWRVAAPGTRFGLPEVHVGLVPGAGGTQRAPRLIGAGPALRLVQGETIGAEEMLAAGGLDAIGDVESFLADLPPRPRPIRLRPAPDDLRRVLEEARPAIARRARGQASPLHALDALGWAALPFDEGQPRERDLHLALRASDESRALRHVFFAERAAARPAAIRGATPRDIRRVAVAGGGLMGTGIATALLSAGLSVTLIERDAGAAEAARARIDANLDGAVKRGKLDADGRARHMAALTCATDYGTASDHDLAIEAVFEDIATKRTVFRALAAAMPHDALLATNTSYLDPRDIFDGVPTPERCLGLHFFSPAHVMKLLEIVALPATSADTLATAFALAKRLRKVAVLAGICDGFIGNRMLAAYRRAAEYLLLDGATPAQVDAAMRGFGMAMGPFEAQDMAGLQIAQANRRRQDATRDPAERYSRLGDLLCESGRTGQRAGKGWHRYDGRTARPDPDVEALIAGESARLGLRRRPFTETEIQTRLLAILANEGARIVAEGIAEDAAAIDVVQVNGYGFPRWRGGPVFAARSIDVRAALDAADADSPGSFPRADIFT